MKKNLIRPRKGRIVAGVSLALADYFNINVIFVRFFWVLLLLPGGIPGIIPYVILWILIPSEEKSVEVTT